MSIKTKLKKSDGQKNMESYRVTIHSHITLQNSVSNSEKKYVNTSLKSLNTVYLKLTY